MSELKTTPGPWRTDGPTGYGNIPGVRIVEDAPLSPGYVIAVAIGDVGQLNAKANADLMAASPELYNGCNALLGLVQLVLNRADLPGDLQLTLLGNHRIAEARAAVAKARGETPSESPNEH